MVASADGDVAATVIHYAKLGSIAVYIAKNETSQHDEHQMIRLMGLCAGDLHARYEDFRDFALKGLAFTIPFCNAKMKKRLKAISTDALEDAAKFLDSNPLPEFTTWDAALTAGEAIDPRVVLRQLGCGPLLADGGDRYVLSWAQEIKCPLASIVPYQLRFVSSELQAIQQLLDGTVEGNERFLMVSGICDKLHHSALFEKLWATVDIMDLEMKEKVKSDLGKLGAYYRSLEQLYVRLSQPCQKGAAPLKINCRLLRAPPKTSIKLAGRQWYEFVEKFWSTIPHGGPLGLSKESLLKEWADGRPGFHIPEKAFAAYHCELQLLGFLKTIGVYKGFIGVSKSCCELCSSAIAKMNLVETDWRASAGHGRIYLGLLPTDPKIADGLREIVDMLLKDEIRKIRLKTESPVVRAFHKEIGPLEELEPPAMKLVRKL
jgi:hypothetical protein